MTARPARAPRPASGFSAITPPPWRPPGRASDVAPAAVHRIDMGEAGVQTLVFLPRRSGQSATGWPHPGDPALNEAAIDAALAIPAQPGPRMNRPARPVAVLPDIDWMPPRHTGGTGRRFLILMAGLVVAVATVAALSERLIG